MIQNALATDLRNASIRYIDRLSEKKYIIDYNISRIRPKAVLSFAINASG